jgi:hypothetical protein
VPLARCFADVPRVPVYQPIISRRVCVADFHGKLRAWKLIAIVFAFCAASAIASPTQSLTTLVDFNGTNGAIPIRR